MVCESLRVRRGGRQVMRVVKVKYKGCRYSNCVIGSLVRDKAKHFKDMNKVLKRFFGNLEILVQQGIDLVKVGNNGTMDLRAELQRNKSVDGRPLSS
nr:YheC/YheD family protein [Paenibacillus sp. N3.4]